MHILITRSALRVNFSYVLGASSSSPSSELPTLFGSTKKKADVVSLVLLSGNNINDGFGTAFRIIQVYVHLDEV